MAKRFLLIGWEAADWQLLNPLLDAGDLPTLNRLVETGVVGDLASTQPLNTAAQWTSIATGKRPWRHGITCSREFDATQNQMPVIGRKHRRAVTIWEILARQNIRCIAVGWPATHGSEVSGAQIVSDRYSEPTAGPGIKPWPPAISGTYWPHDIGTKLDPLRASPEWIGADLISKYIPDWRKIDQQRDRRLGQLRVLLTPDFSHQAATVGLLEAGDWNFATVRFPALGHIARLFLPLVPPRRPWVSEQDFSLYHAVVKAECRLLDQMLARLQQLAGPDAVIMVVSAHGTKRPDTPPAGFPPHDPDGWKTSSGLFAISGPGLVCDGLLHGASVLDVTPTILSWYGLPLAEDMEGRVLVEAFETMPTITRVPTWEVPQESSPIVTSALASEPSAAKALRQEQVWNFAQSCLEAGQLQEAWPALDQLFHEFPERAEFAQALFQCQLNLNQLPQAEETLEVLLETLPPGLFALLPQAELALAKRDLSLARRFVNEALQLNPTHPGALRRIGVLLLKLRDWTTLAEQARAALARDQDDPIIWLGLAAASLRLQQPAEAEQAARRAIQLRYFLPDAHFVLSRALVVQNKWSEARDCLAALVKLQPDNKSVAGYNRRLTARFSTESKR
ncbi:MAG: alkaline phosphatase family protein [Verrucomicrobiota bacterium]